MGVCERAPVEPLVLRANAGDCIKSNCAAGSGCGPDQDGFGVPPVVINQRQPDQAVSHVGLRSLLSCDISRRCMNVGTNSPTPFLRQHQGCLYGMPAISERPGHQ